MELTALQELPARLRDGDLPWLQTQYDTGALAQVSEHVTSEQWTAIGTALHAGDLETVRANLKGVEIEGVGPLVLAKRNRVPLIVGGAIVAVAIVGLVIWLLARGEDAPSEAVTTTAATTETTRAEPDGNIVEVVAGNPHYSTLAQLLTSSGLTSLLSETGPYTLFAPDNAAFEALGAEQLATLESDDDLARNVLAYQIVLGNYPTSALKSGPLTSLEGNPLAISVQGTRIKVDSATIIDPDLTASNGVVQGIDQLLLPPDTSLD